MSSIGELFGFPGEQNDTPFDAATLDQQLDRILHDPNRPVPGAPDGYQRPGFPPQAPQGDGVGATGGTPGPPASVALETPAAPPPFGWPAGPASAYPPAPATPPGPPPAPPPAAPGQPPVPPGPPAAPAGTPPPAPDPFAALNDLQRLEAMQIVAALQDPDRAAGIRRAYIGAPEPIGGVPAGPPPAAPPAPFAMPAPLAPPPAPAPLPAGIEEGTPEELIWRTQQEQQRQLEEIRQGVAAQTQQSENELTVAAAGQAVQAFTARYGDRLTSEEIAWLCQTAGYQKLPDAFRTSNPGLTREAAFAQALEFQLRSTDTLFAKIVSGVPAVPATVPPGAPPAAPPAAPAPVVFPGQTPEADARHRYLTALSSAASPSGEAPSRTPLAHRPDGKLDERSRMQLVQEMTSGGTMGELMGPN